MTRWKAGAGSGLLALMLSALAGAQGWNINGTNTLRVENYRVTGDTTAAPYASLGNYGFNEINLNASRRASAFDQWRVQFSGVANASPYRTEFHGLVAERMAIVRENGNSNVPYRFELGDLLSSYSLRTLQQSIKGGQAEFQLSEGARQQSFIVTAGALQQQWSKFQGGDDALAGASWLMQDAQLGRFSANWVHSGRAADAARGLLSRNQSVYSLAGEKSFKHAWGQTTLEGELGHFDGDHDVAQSKQDAGIFAQLGGAQRGRLYLPFSRRALRAGLPAARRGGFCRSRFARGACRVQFRRRTAVQGTPAAFCRSMGIGQSQHDGNRGRHVVGSDTAAHRRGDRRQRGRLRSGYFQRQPHLRHDAALDVRQPVPSARRRGQRPLLAVGAGCG